MEWLDILPVSDDLPIIIEGRNDNLIFGFEQGGFVLFQPYYDRIEPILNSLERMLGLAGLSPTINGMDPKELLGEITLTFSQKGIVLSYSILVMCTLLVVKLKGWLIEGKQVQITDGIAVSDEVVVKEFMDHV